MRIVKAAEVTAAVKKMYIEMNYVVREDYRAALGEALQKEISKLGKDAIRVMIENYDIAKTERVPMCQDTGIPVVFVDLGNEVHIEGDLHEAVNEGLRQAQKEGFLRASIVRHPLQRVNTKDNTPGIVHVDIVKGDRVTLNVLAKGGGSENKSKLFMLVPNDGVEGVKRVVLETVSKAGPDACPPFLVGVGIGGSYDYCATLAKRALTRKIGTSNPDEFLDKLEKELCGEINNLGVGPQGLGGITTCFAVHIEAHPCHIASLPVGVNIQCNACRHLAAVI